MSIVSRAWDRATHTHVEVPHPHIKPLDTSKLTGELKNELTHALGIEVSNQDLMDASSYADEQAKKYNEDHPENGSFCDCVTVVASACAATGAIVGGVAAGGTTAGTAAIVGAAAGAALGAGGGYPMGRLVCERYYDRTPCN